MVGFDVAPVTPQARLRATASGSTESNHAFVPVAISDARGVVLAVYLDGQNHPSTHAEATDGPRNSTCSSLPRFQSSHAAEPSARRPGLTTRVWAMRCTPRRSVGPATTHRPG